MNGKELPDNMAKETFVRDIELLHTDLLPFTGLDQQLEVRNNLSESDLSPEDAAMYQGVINIINKHNKNLIRYGLQAVDMGKIIIVNAKTFCGFIDSIPPEPLESKGSWSLNQFRFHIRNSILYGIVNQLSWYGDVSDPDSIQLNYLLDLLKNRPKIRELLIAKNLHQDDAFYEVEQVLQVAKQGYLQEFHWAKKMLLLSAMHRSHLSLGYESHSTKYLALSSSPSIMISNIEEHTDLIKNIYFKIQSFLKDPKLKVFAQQLCLDFDRFIKREFVHKEYNVQVLKHKKYDRVIETLEQYYYTLGLYQKDMQKKHTLDVDTMPYYSFFTWEKFLKTLYSHQIRELAQVLQAGTRTNDPVVSLFLEFIQTHPEIKPLIKLTLDNDYKHILRPQYENFDRFEKMLVEHIDQNKETKQIEQQLKKGLGEFLMQNDGASILQALKNLKSHVQDYGMFDHHVPGYVVKRKLLDLPESQQKNIIGELSKLKDKLKPFHKYIAADTLFMLCSGYYIRRALHYFQELKYRVVVGTECTAPYLQDYSQGTISLAEYTQRMGSEYAYLEQLLWNIDYHIETIEFFMSKTTDI